MITFNIIMIAVLFFLSGVNLTFSFVSENTWEFNLFAFIFSFGVGCYNVYETISLLP